MKITKRKTEFGTNIFLEEDNKYISIFYGGNEDLYWSINKEEDNDNIFIITKENYNLYHLFEKLFYDIENINIYDINFNNITREEFKRINYANYNELYNKNTKTITWYSDETSHLVGNILKIRKEEDKFKLEFKIQRHIPGYDEDFHSNFSIPIRFRNSGSRYHPFNLVFMKMYNELKEIDDVYDIGHQIHYEEYLYSKKKQKILKK